MSSSVDMTKISFADGDKLVGASNYMVWAFLFEQILREKGLWELVQPPIVQALAVQIANVGTSSSTTPARANTSNTSTSLATVLYIPSITRNLLSIGKLADQGHTVVFNSKHCYVINTRNNSLFLTGTRDPLSKLYKLTFATRSAAPTNQCNLVHQNALALK